MPRISKYNVSEKKENKYKTALYIRLSREDGDKIESDSIVNQRHMLEAFIENHNDEFSLVDAYCDDNYTGTNFNRPSFKKMIEDVKSKKINCIVVKDLSRFGRDYIDTGMYLERFFPEYNVRFIALNDNIDSEKIQYDMLMPVRNIFNEQYARDISKKVQSAFKTKQLRGEFIGAFASYGYLKDPRNKNKLVVDEYASIIVKRIFQLFLDGKGKISIAMVLNREGILCPSEYKKQNGLNYNNGQKLEGTQYWTYATIHRMLNNEIYIGNMVQHKNNRSNFRNKASLTVGKDEWIIVENTHEPIIDMETWKLTQDLLQRDTRVVDFTSNISLFAGFIKCADCGRALCRTVRNNVASYLCGSYKRYGAGICSSHSTKEDVLQEIILNELKNFIGNILNIDKLLDEITSNQQSSMIQKNIESQLLKLEADKLKVFKLKKAIYEDYKLGDLSRDDYLSYKEDYEKQEENINLQIESLNSEYKSKKIMVERDWIKQFKKYKNINQLDRDVLATFIENIFIGEDKKIEIKFKFSEQTEALSNIVNLVNVRS
jgi:DNA invertase Pin-like site-specific DNA recombinase